MFVEDVSIQEMLLDETRRQQQEKIRVAAERAQRNGPQGGDVSDSSSLRSAYR